MEELGLSGWVRNLSDGGVEVVAEGEKNQVNQLIKLAKNGPSSPEVRCVSVF